MNDYGVLLDSKTVRFERLLPGPIDRVWGYLVERLYSVSAVAGTHTSISSWTFSNKESRGRFGKPRLSSRLNMRSD